MRSHLSMFNNSLGSGPTAVAAGGTPQPPPRRRANSVGAAQLTTQTRNPRTGRNRQSSVVVGMMQPPPSSLFDHTDMVSILVMSSSMCDVKSCCLGPVSLLYVCNYMQIMQYCYETVVLRLIARGTCESHICGVSATPATPPQTTSSSLKQTEYLNMQLYD